MTILEIIIIAFSLPIIFFLLLPFLTVVISLFVKDKKYSLPKKETDFACIITAFQNGEIAIPLIDSILKQRYSNYHIYLVADDCDSAKLNIDHDKLTILKPHIKLGSKVKSMKYAIENFLRAHEALIIFDPDNLAHPEFLSGMNKYFANGYKAVQGKRVAKNLDTNYACLDAAGEIFHNYVDRYVPYKLGSSATIAGSGMAIETEVFKQYLKHKQITSNLDKVILGEDKILQSILVLSNIKIAFAGKALIYDEKVNTGNKVARQRTRWINAYFQNLPNAFMLCVKGFANFKINPFLIGLFTLYPPLFMLTIGSFIFFLISVLLDLKIAFILMGSFFVFILNFFLVIKLDNAPKAIWQSLWSIPYFMFNQIKALFNLKKSKSDFLTTQNEKTLTIEEVMNKKL